MCSLETPNRAPLPDLSEGQSPGGPSKWPATKFAVGLGQGENRPTSFCISAAPLAEKALKDQIRMCARPPRLPWGRCTRARRFPYCELLVAERKSKDGRIAQQLETLKNRTELAKIGFSAGIGYIPFAGIGWDACRTIHKKDPNPVRVVAATFLAHDSDPASTRALVKATGDKDWIARGAAVEAIALRAEIDPAAECGDQVLRSQRKSSLQRRGGGDSTERDRRELRRLRKIPRLRFTQRPTVRTITRSVSSFFGGGSFRITPSAFCVTSTAELSPSE